MSEADIAEMEFVKALEELAKEIAEYKEVLVELKELI